MRDCGKSGYSEVSIGEVTLARVFGLPARMQLLTTAQAAAVLGSAPKHDSQLVGCRHPADIPNRPAPRPALQAGRPGAVPPRQQRPQRQFRPVGTAMLFPSVTTSSNNRLSLDSRIRLFCPQVLFLEDRAPIGRTTQTDTSLPNWLPASYSAPKELGIPACQEGSLAHHGGARDKVAAVLPAGGRDEERHSIVNAGGSPRARHCGCGLCG